MSDSGEQTSSTFKSLVELPPKYPILSRVFMGILFAAICIVLTIWAFPGTLPAFAIGLGLSLASPLALWLMLGILALFSTMLGVALVGFLIPQASPASILIPAALMGAALSIFLAATTPGLLLFGPGLVSFLLISILGLVLSTLMALFIISGLNRRIKKEPKGSTQSEAQASSNLDGEVKVVPTQQPPAPTGSSLPKQKQKDKRKVEFDKKKQEALEKIISDLEEKQEALEEKIKGNLKTEEYNRSETYHKDRNEKGEIEKKLSTLRSQRDKLAQRNWKAIDQKLEPLISDSKRLQEVKQTHFAHFDYEFEESYSQGDCFYDSIMQTIPKEKLPPEIASNPDRFERIKWLRTQCQKWAKQNKQWFQDNTSLVEALDSKFNYDTYVEDVGYSVQDSNRERRELLIVWGTQVDMFIVCKLFNVRIHAFVVGTKGLEHQLIHQDMKAPGEEHDEKEIVYNEAFYNDQDILHIANAHDTHYVPLVKRTHALARSARSVSSTPRKKQKEQQPKQQENDDWESEAKENDWDDEPLSDNLLDKYKGQIELIGQSTDGNYLKLRITAEQLVLKVGTVKKDAIVYYQEAEKTFYLDRPSDYEESNLEDSKESSTGVILTATDADNPSINSSSSVRQPHSLSPISQPRPVGSSGQPPITPHSSGSPAPGATPSSSLE